MKKPLTLTEILVFALLYSIAEDLDRENAKKAPQKLLMPPKCECCTNISECGKDCRCCLGICSCAHPACYCKLKNVEPSVCPRCKTAWAYHKGKNGTSYCDLCGTIWHSHLRTHIKNG